MFVLVGFDMSYLRPSELLTVGRGHVSPRCRRAGPQYSKSWTLCIAPAPEEYRTKTGLADVSIVIGDKGAFILELFVPFFRNSQAERLFPFELDFVERQFTRAVRSLRLLLRLTPHVLRHSGPSCDRFEALRSLEEIRRRGQ